MESYGSGTSTTTPPARRVAWRHSAGGQGAHLQTDPEVPHHRKLLHRSGASCRQKSSAGGSGHSASPCDAAPGTPTIRTPRNPRPRRRARRHTSDATTLERLRYDARGRLVEHRDPIGRLNLLEYDNTTASSAPSRPPTPPTPAPPSPRRSPPPRRRHQRHQSRDHLGLRRQRPSGADRFPDGSVAINTWSAAGLRTVGRSATPLARLAPHRLRLSRRWRTSQTTQARPAVPVETLPTSTPPTTWCASKMPTGARPSSSTTPRPADQRTDAVSHPATPTADAGYPPASPIERVRLRYLRRPRCPARRFERDQRYDR